MPGSSTSAMYWAAPVTFSRPSTRSTFWPTTRRGLSTMLPLSLILPRQGGGDRRAHRSGRGLNGVDDLVVAGAAAEVAEHRLLDLVVRGIGVLGQQRGGSEYLP